MEQDIDTLDWMSAGDQSERKAKLHASRRQDRLSRSLARLLEAGSCARRRLWQCHARRGIRKPSPARQRSASRSIAAIGYEPAHRECLLQPEHERHQFSCGHSAAAVLRHRATDAENYGHIGAIVGHELTHGFDDQGRQFDGDGNLKDWWTAEDGKQFDAEGRLRGEGVRQFRSRRRRAREWQADPGREYRRQWRPAPGLHARFWPMPSGRGIDLDQKAGRLHAVQQFFLGFGQNWCGSTAASSVRLQSANRPHFPGEFRVNGVVQNMPEFGQAFGCKTGQPMMPANACRVW